MIMSLSFETLEAIKVVHALATERVTSFEDYFSDQELEAIETVQQWLYGGNASKYD